MKLNNNILKKLSLGVTLVMTTSFIGCSNNKDDKKESSRILIRLKQIIYI